LKSLTYMGIRLNKQQLKGLASCKREEIAREQIKKSE